MYGPIIPGVGDLTRMIVEQKKISTKSEKAIVIITTSGGLIEEVDRIVTTLRENYKIVEFVIPNFAYSAGTVLVMSGDEIHMDYYSQLGPIDP